MAFFGGEGFSIVFFFQISGGIVPPTVDFLENLSTCRGGGRGFFKDGAGPRALGRSSAFNAGKPMARFEKNGSTKMKWN